MSNITSILTAGSPQNSAAAKGQSSVPTRFYSSRMIPLPALVQKVSLNREPNTPQEVVSLLRQLPRGDSRIPKYVDYAVHFIKTFASNPTIMKGQIDGLITLVLSENQEITHSVINQLINRISTNALLNLDVVNGLADAINLAKPSHLNADDLIQILFSIVERISKTHTKGAEKSLENQLRALIRVLNAMVDANICDLPRDKQEDIKKLLSQFADSDSAAVQCLALYAKEALIRVPNDESKLAAFFRVSSGLVKGVYYFYSAISKLDPGKLVDGFFAFQDSLSGIGQFAQQIKETLSEALPEAQEGLQNLAEATSSLRQRKLTWYEQIRYVEMLIASNSFQALESLLFNSKLQKEPVFINLVVETLHQVVLTHSVLEVRQETLKLLQNFYQNDKAWNAPVLTEEHFQNKGPLWTDLSNRDAIRTWIGIKGSIVSDLETYQEIPELSEAKNILEQIIRNAKNAERAFISDKRVGVSKIVSSPISQPLIFVPNLKQQFTLEAKLEAVKLSIAEEPSFKQEKKIYTPLMGTPFQGSKVRFDLLEEVQKFLKGDQRVLLLLGPTGSGKSFFSQILADTIWENYQPDTGMIAFYVSLPATKDPGENLINQALKRYGFTADEIGKLKQSRNVVWILDGYDEIPEHTELLEKNGLLEFKSKIIVTCREEAMPLKDLFIPVIKGKPKESLLQEMHLAPFSPSQMDYFLGKCIELGNTEWDSISQYKEHIQAIPGLLDLAENPFIFKIITDTLPEIIDRHKHMHSSERLTVTRHALYKCFMGEWFQKGLLRARGQFSELKALGVRLENLKKEAETFCIELANAMHIRGLTHVQYDPSQKDDTWNPWLGDDPKAKLLRSMSPLRITSTGDYSFIHKSLMEYFITQGSSKDPVQKMDTNLPIFHSPLEPSIWLFHADLAKSDPSFENALFALIENSKTDLKYSTAAANALSILNLAGVSFSGRDLQGIRAPGAYLHKANFVGANLRKADLTGANLSDAMLSFAQLEGAQMGYVQFGQYPLIQCDSPVTALCCTPDEKHVIGGCADGSIRIWDWKTGEQLKKLQGPTDKGKVILLILFEEGKKLISQYDYHNTSLFWDLKSGKEIKQQNQDQILGAFEGGNKLISGTSHGPIRYWDVKTDKTLATFEPRKQGMSLIPIAVTETGDKLAVGGSHQEIYLYERGKNRETLQVEGWTFSLAFFEQAQKIIYGTNSDIHIFDLESKKIVKTLKGHFSTVYSLVLCEEEKKLISAGLDQTIRIWDLESGEQLMLLQGHTEAVHSLSLLEKAKKIVSVSQDMTVRIWDLESTKSLKASISHESPVECLALTDQGNNLISGSHDSTFCIWDPISGKRLKRLESGRPENASRIVLLEEGKKMAVQVQYGQSLSIRQLELWDLEEGKRLMVLKMLSGEIAQPTGLLKLGKEKYLVSYGQFRFSSSHAIALWSLDHSTSADYSTFDKIQTAIAFKNQNLILAGIGKAVLIWDINARSERNFWKNPFITLEGHSDEVHFIIPLDDEKKLLTASKDKTLRIWDWKTGQTLKIMTGHEKNILSVLVTDNDETAISTSEDKTLRIWDLKEGRLIKTFTGPLGEATLLGLLQRGRKIVSQSDKKTLSIWDREGKLLKTLKHNFPIHSVKINDPDTIYVGEEMGSILAWKMHFSKDRCDPELLWVTNPTLLCSEVNLRTIQGLSDVNRRLMMQHGADNR